MVGAGIEISGDSKKNLFEQIKEIFTEIESHKIELGLDTKVLDQIKTVKSAIDTLQEQKNIELNLEGLEKIQNDFKLANSAIDSFKEQLKSITKSNDVSIKLNDDQAIATIKTLEGQIQKLNFDINKSANGTITGFTLDENQPVKSIVDKSSQVEQKQAIQQQNDLYKETQTLLKQIYQLDNAITDAQQKGMTRTQQQLELMKQQKENALNSNWDNLNSDNQIKLQQQANELINNKTLNETKYQDKIEAENAQIQKQIELYREQMQIKLQNLNTSGGDALKNEGIQSEIEAIKSALSGLNINNYDDNVKKINTQLKQTQANIREVNSEASKTNGFFDNIISSVGKFAQWTIAATALMQTINQIKEAITYINQMDDATADLNKVVDMSESQLNDMGDAAVDMGKKLGQSSLDIMQGFAETGRVFKDTADIEDFTKTATMAANVTDLTVQQASKDLQTTILTFHQNAKDAMTDLDQWNQIQNQFRTSAEDLADGINKVGAAANQSGTSITSLEGYITAITSATGITGSEAGSALQSMISRTFRLGTEGAEDAGKSEKILKSIGVNIRDSADKFKSFSTILDEVHNKWNTLSNTEQVNIAQQIGSTHHYSQFISLMENYKTAQDATNAAINSNNSAVDENEKYLNSWSGKVGTLKATLEGFYKSILNSDITKGFVDILTQIISKFGNLQSIILLATTALLVFKGQAIMGLISSVVEAGVGFTALTGGVYGVVAAIDALTTAFATNPIGMIAIAVTGLITAFTLLHKSTQDEVNELNKMQSNESNMQSTVSNLQQQAQALKDLNSKTTLTNDEKTKLQSINSDLTSQYPELISYYDKESKSFQVNIDKLNELIKKKQELAMQQNASDIDKSTSKKESAQSQLDKDNEMLNNINKGTANREQAAHKSEILKDIQNQNDVIEKANQVLNQGTKYINDYYTSQEKLGKSSKEIKTALEGLGFSSKTIDNALKMAKSSTDKSTDSSKNSSKAVKDNTSSIQDNTNALEDNQQAVDDDGQAIDKNVDTMTKAMDNIKEYSKYIKDMNDNSGHLPSSDIDEITKKHTQLIPYLNNEADLYKEIQNMILLQKHVADDAYKQEMENSEEYWNANKNIQKSMIDGINDIAKKDADLFKGKQQEYINDINNAKTMSEAEKALEKDLNDTKLKLDKEYEAERKKLLSGAKNTSGATGDTATANGFSDSASAALAAGGVDVEGKLNYDKQKQALDDVINNAKNKISGSSIIDSSDATSEGLNKTTEALKEQKQQAEEDKLEMKDYNNQLNALKLTEKALDDALQNTNQHSQEAINLLRQKASLIKQEISLTEQQIKTQEALAQSYTNGTVNNSYSGGTSSSSSNLGSWKNNQYASTVQSTASKYGVDPNLVAAIIQQESSWNANINPSSAGAIGLMQLMPSTASSLGVNPYSVQGNIEGGVKYLSQLLKQFGGDYAKAIAAYNAGAGAVEKYGGTPPYSETQDYVQKVEGYYQQYGGNLGTSEDQQLQNQKNAQQAQANALQLKGNLLDLEQTLKEIPFQEFQANIGIMEDSVEKFANEVNIAKDTISNFSDDLDYQSQAKDLWEQANVAEGNKLKILQQERDYVQSQINTSGYTSADYAQMDAKLQQLNDDIVKYQAEEDELAKNWIETSTTEYEHQINYLDKLSSRYQTATEVMRNNYSEVVKYRQSALDDELQKHQQLVAEENWLESQINSGRFDWKTLEVLKDKLRDVQDQDLQTVDSLEKLREELMDSQFDEDTKQFSDNIDKLKASLELMTKIGVENNGQQLLDTYNDLINNQEKYREGVENTISSIKDQMNALEQTGQTGGSAYVWLKEELDKYTKDLQTSNSDIQETFDNLTNAMLTEQTSVWENSKKILDRNISDMEKALDNEQNKLSWMEQQQDALSNKADLQKQLVALQADTSGENASKIRDIQKQITEANKTQTKDEVDHRISTEKQGLEDLKSTRDQMVQDAEDQIKDAITADQKQLNRALVDSNNLAKDGVSKLGDLVQTELVDKIKNINDIVKETVLLINNSSGVYNPFDLQASATSNSSLSSLQTLLGTNISKTEMNGNMQYTPILDSTRVPKTINTNTDNSKTIGTLNLTMPISKEVTQSPETLATYMINGIKKKGYTFNSQ